MFSFDLRPDEKLIKIYRQSESLLIKPVFLAMLAIYVPMWFLLKYDLLVKFGWFLALWTVVVLVYALRTYFLWLLRNIIITSKRVVLVEYGGIFKRQTQELAIRDIGAVRQKSSGMLSVLFGYGTVELDGKISQPIILKDLQSPGKIKDLIWKLKEGSDYER